MRFDVVFFAWYCVFVVLVYLVVWHTANATMVSSRSAACAIMDQAVRDANEGGLINWLVLDVVPEAARLRGMLHQTWTHVCPEDGEVASAMRAMATQCALSMCVAALLLLLPHPLRRN
jgi:hypothetical protein